MFQNRHSLFTSTVSPKNPVNLFLMLYILKYKLDFLKKH